MALSKQNFALRRDAASHNSLDNIVGSSAAMEKLKQTLRTVASTASTVLIHGESGTGKELVARAVHVCSPRATEPFVSVNCGAFPETLLATELFGYLNGAFTAANHFPKKYGGAVKRSILKLSQNSLGALCDYEWPGNVRQLENTVERAVALEMTDELHVELPAERPKARAAAAGVGVSGSVSTIGPGAVLPERVGMECYAADIHRTALQSALDRSNGGQTKTSDF